MKVLITGSAGFIGSALCIKLLNLGDSDARDWLIEHVDNLI